MIFVCTQLAKPTKHTSQGHSPWRAGVSNLLGFGIGAGIGKLGIQEKLASAFINKSTSINGIIRAYGLGQLLESGAGDYLAGIAEGMINNDKIPGNPFTGWSNRLKKPIITFNLIPLPSPQRDQDPEFIGNEEDKK